MCTDSIGRWVKSRVNKGRRCEAVVGDLERVRIFYHRTRSRSATLPRVLLSYFLSPPGDGVTSVFSPDVCTGAFAGAPEAKVVWGIKWVVRAVNERADVTLPDNADVTSRRLADIGSMYGEFL